jgi:hypothetical protein
MSIDSPANYLLIDGVLRANALTSLYQLDESVEVEPLYLGTRWAALNDLGPILVSIRGSSGFVNETCRSATGQPDASLLYSLAPMSVVAAHLRRFIAPPDVLGGNGLLRFADPLVARHWLGSYQGAQLDTVLGPIDAWHVPEHPHSWEPVVSLEWRRIFCAAPSPEWVDSCAQLGETQLGALDQAARWRFMEKLHQSLEQSLPQHLARIDISQLTRWFHDRLNEAQAWGLGTQRSLAIWVEYSLRWGEGFTLRADGPYQQWLVRTPDAPRFAPELRIQQMDSDFELNKEL